MLIASSLCGRNMTVNHCTEHDWCQLIRDDHRLISQQYCGLKLEDMEDLKPNIPRLLDSYISWKVLQALCWTRHTFSLEHAPYIRWSVSNPLTFSRAVWRRIFTRLFYNFLVHVVNSQLVSGVSLISRAQRLQLSISIYPPSLQC